MNNNKILIEHSNCRVTDRITIIIIIIIIIMIKNDLNNSKKFNFMTIKLSLRSK